MKNLLLIINEDRFFLSHRHRIAELATQKGWAVTIITKDTGKRSEIEAMGYKYLELPINPTGMNPFDEFKTYRFLKHLFKNNKDSVVHLVGLKNMLWGGLAARTSKPKGVLFAVSGLGTLFGENGSGFVSKGIRTLLKIGLHNKNVAVIFQNHDDEKLFREEGLIGDCHIFFIKGSGVNLNEYSYTTPSKELPVKVIFTGRMLKEKGVEDLVAAAEILRKDFEGKVEFILCGGLSSNPHALTKQDMDRLTDGKYIKWLGHRNDICQLLKRSHIMCFPSYYREGVPKSVIEASAVGLPIITTDSVGCRDTVKEGFNGLIVKPHSPEQIAKALEKLISDPEIREKMGRNSREIAVKDYNVEDVAATHLQIYNLLDGCPAKR